MTEKYRTALHQSAAQCEPQASSASAGDRSAEAGRESVSVSQARRRFFKAALGAPVLAAAATAAPAVGTAPTGGTREAPPPRQSGYHETRHIRTYYELAAY